MKAILQYGQFTHLIEVADNDARPTIQIMKPIDEPSFVPLPTVAPETIESSRLEFRYDKRLDDQFYLYKFVREL